MVFNAKFFVDHSKIPIKKMNKKIKKILVKNCNQLKNF